MKAIVLACGAMWFIAVVVAVLLEAARIRELNERQRDGEERGE